MPCWPGLCRSVCWSYYISVLTFKFQFCGHASGNHSRETGNHQWVYAIEHGAKRKVHSSRDSLKGNGVRMYLGQTWGRRWELKVIKAPRVCSKERIHAHTGRVNEDEKVLRKASTWKGFQTTRRTLDRAKTFCKNESVLRTEKRLKKTVTLFSKTCKLADKWKKWWHP